MTLLQSLARNLPVSLMSKVASDPLRAALSGRAMSGMDVDEATALSVSTVYACANLISSSVAALPLHVYSKTGNGRQIAEDDSTMVIWGRPNPEVAKVTFWETAILHAVVTGNSFSWVKKGRGGAEELWPIDPSRVEVKRDDAGRKVYVLDGDPAKAFLDYFVGGTIFHVPNLGYDGLKGMSPIKLARESIALAIASERYGANTFRQGGMPRSVLSVDKVLKKEDIDLIAAEWEERYGGTANSGKPAILGMGTKWQQVSMNPEDAQMLETRRFQVNDIARWFRVPPEMVGGSVETGALTYANIEDRNLHFVTFTLQPWISRFEQTISDELLPPDRYARFDLRGLLRANSVTRASVYEKALNPLTGWMNRDEVRALEEMEPNGEDGARAVEGSNIPELVNAAGILIRSGFEPAAALSAVGLNPIKHLGLLPVTLQSPDKVEADAKAAANAGG